MSKVAPRVEVQSSTGESLDVRADRFKPPPRPGHYYQLKIRRHASGGCQPLVVQGVEKLTKAGVSLNPTESQIREGILVLDGARSCAHQQAGACAGEPKVSGDFDSTSQAAFLDRLNTQSMGACPARAVADAWPKIDADAKRSRLIVCAETTDGEETALEFLRVQDAGGQERLHLNRLF